MNRKIHRSQTGNEYWYRSFIERGEYHGVIYKIGGALILFFGILMIIRKKNCKTEIKGTFVDSVPIKIHLGEKYSANHSTIFQYVYEGVEYKSQCIEPISSLKVRRLIPGEKYTIYVHDKKPKYFVMNRELRVGNYLAIVIGVLALLM